MEALASHQPAGAWWSTRRTSRDARGELRAREWEEKGEVLELEAGVNSSYSGAEGSLCEGLACLQMDAQSCFSGSLRGERRHGLITYSRSGGVIRHARYVHPAVES